MNTFPRGTNKIKLLKKFTKEKGIKEGKEDRTKDYAIEEPVSHPVNCTIQKQTNENDTDQSKYESRGLAYKKKKNSNHQEKYNFPYASSSILKTFFSPTKFVPALKK